MSSNVSVVPSMSAPQTTGCNQSYLDRSCVFIFSLGRTTSGSQITRGFFSRSKQRVETVDVNTWASAPSAFIWYGYSVTDSMSVETNVLKVLYVRRPPYIIDSCERFPTLHPSPRCPYPGVGVEVRRRSFSCHQDLDLLWCYS